MRSNLVCSFHFPRCFCDNGVRVRGKDICWQQFFRYPDNVPAHYHSRTGILPARVRFSLPGCSMAELRGNRQQFSRAIRKTALTCLLRLRRCFPHIRALTPRNSPIEKSCKHDFLSRAVPWLNCSLKNWNRFPDCVTILQVLLKFAERKSEYGY